MMVILNISQTIQLNDDKSWKLDFDPVGILYIFYAVIWIVSIYVQFFEYKRGLPHSWYCHQLFW